MANFNEKDFEGLGGQEGISFSEEDFAEPGRSPDVIDRILPRPVAQMGGRGKADFPPGELNATGEMFQRTQAGIRAFIQDKQKNRLKSLARGLRFPEEVPTFVEQEQARELEEDFRRNFKPTGNKIEDALQSAKIRTKSAGRIVGAALLDAGADPLLIGGIIKGALTKGPRIAGQAFDRFREPFRAAFMNENILPRVQKLFRSSVDDFGKGIQKFAVRKHGANKEMVKHIKSRGVNNIRISKIKQADDLDVLKMGVDDAVKAKGENIKNLYSESFKNVDDTDLINVDDFYLKASKDLRQRGLLDSSNKLTEQAKLATTEPKVKALAELVDSLSPQAIAGSTKPRANVIGPINKEQWLDIRDFLSNTSVKGGTSRGTKVLVEASDALHAGAGKQGIPIQKAREASKKFFENAEVAKKYSKENAFSQIFKVKENARELGQLDDYLGSNFQTRAKDIVSGRVIDKIDNVSIRQAGDSESLIRRNINTLISKGKNKSDINVVKKEFFEDLGLGGKQLDSIFTDILRFRRDKLIKKGIGVTAAGGAAIGANALIQRPLVRAMRESGGGGASSTGLPPQ